MNGDCNKDSDYFKGELNQRVTESCSSKKGHQIRFPPRLSISFVFNWAFNHFNVSLCTVIKSQSVHILDDTLPAASPSSLRILFIRLPAIPAEVKARATTTSTRPGRQSTDQPNDIQFKSAPTLKHLQFGSRLEWSCHHTMPHHTTPHHTAGWLPVYVPLSPSHCQPPCKGCWVRELCHTDWNDVSYI